MRLTPLHGYFMYERHVKCFSNTWHTGSNQEKVPLIIINFYTFLDSGYTGYTNFSPHFFLSLDIYVFERVNLFS